MKWKPSDLVWRHDPTMGSAGRENPVTFPIVDPLRLSSSTSEHTSGPSPTSQDNFPAPSRQAASAPSATTFLFDVTSRNSLHRESAHSSIAPASISMGVIMSLTLLLRPIRSCSDSASPHYPPTSLSALARRANHKPDVAGQPYHQPLIWSRI
jgi:hypothetical protein